MMKQILISMLVLLLLSSPLALARPVSGTVSDKLGSYTGAGSAQGHNIKASLDLGHIDWDALIATGVDIQGLLGLGGVGVVWYVDSTATGTDAGTSWVNACPTWEEAIVLALAGTGDDGDIILLAAGHAETLTAADDVDIDVAGVKSYGLGTGENRPTFTYTANGEVVIGAADVEIHNMNFIAGNATVHAIDVEAGMQNYVINNCRFWTTSVNTDEFIDCIDIAAGSDNGKITNNEFEIGAAAAVSAISHIGSDFTEISGNLFSGDFSTACIEDATTASIWMIIKDNILINGDTAGGLNAVAAISLKADSSNLIINNKIFCDMTEAGSIVSAVGFLADNTYNRTAGSVLEAGKTYALVTTEMLTTSAAQDLFVVGGGPIMITGMFGFCSTSIGSTPGALSLWCDATTSTSDTDFCTAVNADAVAIGGWITFDGVTAGESVLVVTDGVGANEPGIQWICPIGTIEQKTATTGTGGYIWYMTFIPLVDGVTVTAQ